MRPPPDKIIDFMRAMIEYLGLPRYKIVWDARPERREHYASLCVGRQVYEADLRLGKRFDDLDDDMQRQVICHEVIHLTHRRVDTIIEDLDMPLHAERFEVEIELMVDLWANFVGDLGHVKNLWLEKIHGGLIRAA